jgi:hypothetical protein
LVRVSCGAVACKAKVSGNLSVPRTSSTRKHRYALRAVKREIAARKSVNLRVPITARGRRAVRKAMDAGRRSTVRLTVTARPASGSTRRRALKIVITG